MDEQATMLLCGSLQDFAVSPKSICKGRENRFTRGVEVQVFQLRIDIKSSLCSLFLVLVVSLKSFP